MSVVLPFVAAEHFTATKGRSIDILVMHDMEAPEKGDTAESVAAMFARGDREASAHYCIDNNSAVQCVLDKDVAWHAPGANHNGLGFELAGFARQTAADWADAYSEAELRIAAKLVREKADQYRIPLVWLSVADLRAGKRGITSHNNVSLAFRKSTHTDPGPNFPVDHYMALVRGEEEDEVTNEKADQIIALLSEIRDGVKETVRVVHALGVDAGRIKRRLDIEDQQKWETITPLSKAS